MKLRILIAATVGLMTLSVIAVGGVAAFDFHADSDIDEGNVVDVEQDGNGSWDLIIDEASATVDTETGELHVTTSTDHEDTMILLDGFEEYDANDDGTIDGYVVTLNESEMATELDGDDTDEVSVSLTLLEDSETDDLEESTQTGSFFLQANGYSQVVLTGATADEAVSTETHERFFRSDVTTVSAEDDIGVDGANTSVYVVFDDSESDVDEFTDAASDAESGAPVLEQTLWLDNQYVPMYYDDAGDHDTVAVYDTDHDRAMIVLDEDAFENRESVNVEATTEGIGFGNTADLRTGISIFGFGDFLTNWF